MWKYLSKKKLSYIGFGGNGYQVRDVLHIDDLCKLISIQISKISKVNNKIFNVGGGTKNSTDLVNLTNICEKISGNKILIRKNKKTDVSDIPIYVSNNKKILKYYKWKPIKSIFEITTDVYNWQIKNYNLLKKYLN